MNPWYTRNMPFFFLTFFFPPFALLLLVWQWDKFTVDRGIKLFFTVGMTVFIVFGLLPCGSLPVVLPIIFGLITLKLVLNLFKRKTG
ncbi:hypothetical protein [Exiguobacterium sp.]|uniref:hypothetical protein n=1 Tax=Exiguobacterium sp. TaxID=44751 RepID=UPI00263BC21A|nr:hypothetical protein [Exiguobacterium sp.]MCC5891837.1 hypothetical protein [Exiguobacterium sp.]